MHRSLHRFALLSLALVLLPLAPAHGQTPQPSPPAPVYPTVTITGTLAAGTYALVPQADVKAWQDHSASVAKLRALAQQMLDATAPTPPAPPAPQPDPAPKPSPTPTANGKVFVVVIETAAGAPARGQLFADPALSAYMRIRGNRFRIVDANVTGPDGKPPADVAPYLALAAGKTLPQAYIVDSTGRLLYSGTLPMTADGLLALLKKAGG